MESKKEFGAVRSILFPIHSSELKKFVQLGLLFICISISYSLLRSNKDILVMNLPGGGAETIYYLKTFVVMPSVVLFTIVYGAVSRRLGRDALFKATILYFFCFFGIFLFFILQGATRHLAIDESAHQVPLIAISYLITSSGIFLFASALSTNSEPAWSWRAVLLQMIILSIISIPFFNIYNWTLSLSENTTKLSFLRRKAKSGNRFI